MLPQLKLISLVVRVFARPIITSKKEISIQKVQMSKQRFITQQILNLGNAYYFWDQKIDRIYLNQNLKVEYDQLNEDEALKLGTEFFLEILIYTILILVSSFEIWKNYFEQQDRQKNMNNTIRVILMLKQNLQYQIKIIKEQKLKDLNDIQQVYEIYETNLKSFQNKKDKAMKQVSIVKQLHIQDTKKNNQDC
ncbi:unnamed protein product [Paramecium pentaurelia]|uniref:Transmembrane protein n=1 Tax=Paramecium pentaurelia TaxID=43138 RepID=A0A8S1SUI4_9CILI|nr:unnamed protein product [Paramecium pentaurelia]